MLFFFHSSQHSFLCKQTLQSELSLEFLQVRQFTRIYAFITFVSCLGFYIICFFTRGLMYPKQVVYPHRPSKWLQPLLVLLTLSGSRGTTVGGTTVREGVGTTVGGDQCRHAFVVILNGKI
jgi:hypothetical protein